MCVLILRRDSLRDGDRGEGDGNGRGMRERVGQGWRRDKERWQWHCYSWRYVLFWYLDNVLGWTMGQWDSMDGYLGFAW